MYDLNFCFTSAVQGKTPLGAWSKRKPYVTNIKIFDYFSYAKILNFQRTKPEAKTVRCLFLGYCKGTKANSLMCLDIKTITKCCDVVFRSIKNHKRK